jgi:uncharacterized protein YkwD
MTNKKTITPILLSLLLGFTLIACGGGSGDEGDNTQNTDDTTQNNPQEQDSGTTTPDENDSAETPDDTTPPAETTNQPPTATITGVQSATSGETLTLDGSGSSDPDGDTLTYLWTQTQGASATLVDNANPTLSLITPEVTQTTTISFQLSVGDGEFTSSATIDIQLSPITDTTAPAIVSRSPLADAIGVSTTTSVLIRFDEALQENLIDNQSLQVTQETNQVTGTVSYDSATDTLSLTFDEALIADTRYTVTLGSNLQDPSGNPVASTSWDFTTGSAYNLGATSQETIDQCMNDSDKLMLTLVNNARGTDRLCGDTQYDAVEFISWHCLLETAAQGHSDSMAENDYFSHTGLDDSSAGDRITATGYTWRAYAENIAAGYNDEEAVMTAWLESSGHCANIMNSLVTEMGAGTAENPDAQYRIYWTQNFADR